VRKEIVFVVLFILAFGAACATVDTSNEATAHYKLGVMHLSGNRVQHAFVEFHKAYDLDPKNKEVLNAIGTIYLLQFDEPSKAVEYFEKALKTDPEYSEVHNNLGYAHEKMGNFETAVTFYKKAVSNPLYATAEKAFINMGNAYYRLGRYDSAIAAFREAIKRDPNLGLPYMRLALCYNAMGRYGDAAVALKRGIELDPGYKGDAEKAIQDLNLKRIHGSKYDEQDARDLLEILKY
jgi:Tfp pilus assembly protein PilF